MESLVRVVFFMKSLFFHEKSFDIIYIILNFFVNLTKYFFQITKYMEQKNIESSRIFYSLK